MITKDEYEEAERIVLAYQRQMLTVISSVREYHKNGSKSLEDVQEGDSVQCVFVHSSSKKHLTKDKEYEVIFVQADYRFMIKTDSGKIKAYYLTSKHFKVV